MATFNDKSQEVLKLLTLMEKYIKEGKYGSIDLRGKSNKIASLQKLVDSEDEKQLKILEDIQKRYAEIVAIKKSSNETLTNISKNLERETKVLKKKSQEISKTVEEVQKETAEFTDVANIEAVRPKTIKGTEKEQKLSAELVKEFYRLKTQEQEIIKNINKKRAKANKSIQENIDYAKLIDNKLMGMLQSAGFVKKYKNGNIRNTSKYMSSFMDFMYDSYVDGISLEDLTRTIYSHINDSNLKARITKQKTAEDNIVDMPYSGGKRGTYSYNTGRASRLITKYQNQIYGFLNNIMSSFGNYNFDDISTKGKKGKKNKSKDYKDAKNFGKFGGYKQQFIQFVNNALMANLMQSGVPDASAPEDLFGAVFATVEQLIKSENLPEHYARLFGTYNYNKRGRKGKHPDIYNYIEDMKKASVKFYKFSYVRPIGDHGVRFKTAGGENIDVKDENDLPLLAGINGEQITKKDFNNYKNLISFVHTMFPGLATNAKTPETLNKWSNIGSSRFTELTANNMNLLNSNRPLNASELAGLSGRRNIPTGTVIVSTPEEINKTSSKNNSNSGEQSTLGSVLPSGDNSQILLGINGVQHRLSEIIKLLGGDDTYSAEARSKLGTTTDVISDDDVLDSPEPSTGKGKSSYQSKQDRRDRKVDGYRTFIKMLVPALKALLPKHAMWDALKLLLLQFGHNHPKLAAAALLAGPPVVAGAATLAGKALLRGTLGSALGNTPRATAVSRSARALSGAGGRNSIMTNITSNVTSYKNNRDWINYMKGEIPELERKAQVGRAANLLKQNPSRTRVNSDLLDLRIQEGLQAEKDLKYIRRTLPVREKYLIGNRVNAAWNTTQDAVTNFGGNVRSTTNNIWNGARNPQTYIKGAKGYGVALKGFTTGGLGAVGKGFAGFGKGLLGVAKGGLSLAKAAGPEAMLATIVVGAIVGAIKPIAQAIIEPFKIIIDPMKGLMGSLGDAFSGIWAAIKGILHPLIALGDVCWEIGKSVGGLLGNFLKPFVRLLAGPFAVVTNIVINSFRVLGSLIGVVGKVIGTVGTIIGDFIYAIIGLGKVIGRWIKDSPVGKAISGIWEQLDFGIQWVIKSIGGFFTTVTDKIVDFFKSAGDFLTKWWEDFKRNHPILSGLIAVGKGEADTVNPQAIDKSKLGNTSSAAATGTAKTLAQNAKEVVEVAKGYTSKNKDWGVGGPEKTKKLGKDASLGVCAAGVGRAIRKTYGINLTGDAWEYADQLAKSDKFKEVTGYSENDSLGSLPKGAVVVQGKKGKNKFGHTFIVGEDGKGYSDHTQNKMYTGYGNMRVFVPKDSISADNGTSGSVTNTAVNTSAATNTETETSSSTATLTESKVETTDGVRNALLQLAGTVKEKQSKYDAESIVFNATDVTGSMGCWGIVQLNNEGRPVH